METAAIPVLQEIPKTMWTTHNVASSKIGTSHRSLHNDTIGLVNNTH